MVFTEDDHPLVASQPSRPEAMQLAHDTRPPRPRLPERQVERRNGRTTGRRRAPGHPAIVQGEAHGAVGDLRTVGLKPTPHSPTETRVGQCDRLEAQSWPQDLLCDLGKCLGSVRAGMMEVNR